MPTHEQKVEVFDIATGAGRDEYMQLVNDPDVSVTKDMLTIPTGVGALLRVVDYNEVTCVARPKSVYTPPVC